MVFLPLVCFITATVTIYRLFPRCGLRESSLRAAVIVGLFIFLSSEILSLFKAIDLLNLAIWWVLAIMYGVSMLIKQPYRSFPSLPALSLIEKLICLGIAALALIIGINALMAATNSWDSYVYHMALVAHWAQNHTATLYPTNIFLQLYTTPLAEFINLHIYVLSGNNDRLVNLGQYACMMGSLVSVSLIAEQLGANRRGQLIAVALAVTLPMGIVQGATTQNDYVVSFWLLCFLYFMLKLNLSLSRGVVFWTAAALGLALLTKGIAYLYAISMLLVFFISFIERHGFKIPIKVLGVIMMGAVLVNALYYHRLALVKVDNDVQTPVLHLNNHLGIKEFTCNVLNNVSLQLSTPIGQWNKAIEQTIRKVALKVGVNLNDPTMTFSDCHFGIPPFIQKDDVVANTAHLLLILIFMISYVCCWRQFSKELGLVFLCFIFGVLLFNIALKWQPWGGRFHLFGFLMMMAPIAVWLSRRKYLTWVVMLVLLAMALPKSLNAFYQPLVGKVNVFNTPRQQLYLINRGFVGQNFKDAANYLNSRPCYQIGLKMPGSPVFNFSGEYLLWAFLRNDLGPVRIEHVDVSNISAKFEYPLGAFAPCAIVSVVSNKGKKIKLNGDEFELKKQFGFMKIYELNDAR